MSFDNGGTVQETRVDREKMEMESSNWVIQNSETAGLFKLDGEACSLRSASRGNEGLSGGICNHECTSLSTRFKVRGNEEKGKDGIRKWGVGKRRREKGKWSEGECEGRWTGKQWIVGKTRVRLFSRTSLGCCLQQCCMMRPTRWLELRSSTTDACCNDYHRPVRATFARLPVCRRNVRTVIACTLMLTIVLLIDRPAGHLAHSRPQASHAFNSFACATPLTARRPSSIIDAQHLFRRQSSVVAAQCSAHYYAACTIWILYIWPRPVFADVVKTMH